MQIKRAVTGAAMLGFIGLMSWMFLETGPFDWVDPLFSNRPSIVTVVDLSLALSVCVAWMWPDARRRGMNPLPYTLLTVMGGSLGPLLYLFNRAGRASR